MKIRRGDTVVVISGNDRGRQGVVKEVLRSAGRVVVEGVNVRTKHKKPDAKNQKGERVQKEIAIHASNVMHVDPETNKRTRRAPVRVEKSQARAEKGKGR